MTHETSCGAVVYTTEDGSIKYIIIKSKDGIYGFPKGHLEANETTYECALREIREETSLSVDLINGFCVEDRYTFQRKEITVSKRVIYYLAQYWNQSFSPDNREVSQILSLDYTTALSLITHEGAKRVLNEANLYLLHHPRHLINKYNSTHH